MCACMHACSGTAAQGTAAVLVWCGACRCCSLVYGRPPEATAVSAPQRMHAYVRASVICGAACSGRRRRKRADGRSALCAVRAARGPHSALVGVTLRGRLVPSRDRPRPKGPETGEASALRCRVFTAGGPRRTEQNSCTRPKPPPRSSRGVLDLIGRKWLLSSVTTPMHWTIFLHSRTALSSQIRCREQHCGVGVDVHARVPTGGGRACCGLAHADEAH